jgi:hypothetical protein
MEHIRNLKLHSYWFCNFLRESSSEWWMEENDLLRRWRIKFIKSWMAFLAPFFHFLGICYLLFFGIQFLYGGVFWGRPRFYMDRSAKE